LKNPLNQIISGILNASAIILAMARYMERQIVKWESKIPNAIDHGRLSLGWNTFISICFILGIVYGIKNY
jgi:hypothetical protein